MKVKIIKANIPPAEFYAAELPDMKHNRSGWNDGGLCPFHSDGHAGSFRVHTESGAFSCFACGTKGGDIVSFIQQRDGLSFHDALGKLASEWGVR